jgi:GT2 family glycosyltransferase
LEAVDSIRRQSLPPDEVILVIDHNRDLFHRVRNHLQNWIPGGRILGLTIIENRHQQGLSGARNSGIAIASGDIIAFIDEDAEASPDWLERLNSGFQDPRVLGVGGAILPKWLEGRPFWFPQEFDWVVGCTYRGMPSSRAAVRNLIGCNMAFRREVFEAVGGFISGIGRIGKYPAGCEETELCIRAGQRWENGFFMYDPQARVEHRVPVSRATWGYFVERCFAEGRSKARVASLVGSSDGLSNERSYTFHALPQGVMRSVKDALSNKRVGDLGRAAAIFSGLAITTAGYLQGSLAGWLTNQREAGWARWGIERLRENKKKTRQA